MSSPKVMNGGVCVYSALAICERTFVMAVDHRANLAEVLVSARVVRMHVSVDQKTDGLVGERSDCCDDLLRQGSVLIVDEKHPVIADEDTDISARALEVIHAAGHRMYLDFHIVEVRLRDGGACAEKH